MGLDLQSAQYGAPIPVVFGRNKVAGNVVDYMDFQAIGHQQKQPGKGGGGGSSGTTYTYSCSYLLGLCEGPATVVTVYDGSSTKSLAAAGGIGFTGTLGQAPWAHLSGVHAIGYSGTALAAFQNKDLGSSASLPNYNFEMDGRNQFSGTIKDANPADIVTAICTDTQIGINFNALGDLTQFKNYCTAAGIFFSPVYATQQTATQTLDDLFKYSNCAAFFSEGVLKVVPYGDATITGNGVTFTPNVTAVADLGRDDFITNGPGDPVAVKRISPADAMNIQRIEYKDRANTYHTSTVVASIDQDVVSTGARADQSDSVDMITTAPVARLVVQNLLQRTYYIRNTYEFQLSWRYCYLEPMDVVTLTDANTGLYLGPVRITEISEDEHGLLSVVAEEFPDGVSHGGIYATQANAGATVDTNADPGAIDGPYLFRGPGFLVSNNQPEIWCALTGNNPMWAGCDVYLSHDGTSYTYLATHSRRASYGSLTNALTSAADPDTTSAPNIVLNGPAQLLGGTAADADQFITLAMVDQEIIAYQTATLASGPSYTLGYLRRGGYGSAIAAHAINAPFVRLDENILRIPVDPSQIGQTVYLKFVSFNVFGKGGRTLAGETAYTYVIGTNVELPDVPLTPVSFTATGVADGVSLTWTNPNPAAVGCTSIEYATASGGPWTVLAQEGPTATSFSHHFTNGATYFYRARSRGPLVAAGFSAYTAAVSNTGTNVNSISSTATAANATANTANTLATQVPVINGGFDATPYGTGWTMDSQWAVKSDGLGPGVGLGYAQFTPNGSPGAIYNSGRVGVVVGQTYKAQVLVKASSANGVCYVRVRWLDATGVQIAYKNGNNVTGSVTTGSYVVDQAPAGAYYAATMIEVDSCTTGSYQVDNVVATLQPSTIDEVPDGPVNARTLATRVNAGNPLIDFSAAYHLNKNADNIGDGTTYGRFKMASMTGNDFDFSKGGVNKTVDYIGDGTNYGRPLNSRLNANRPLIDFADTFQLNKNVDNLADGASYGRPLLSRLNGGNPLIDFSAAYHLNKNLSNIGDGGGRFAAIQANADNTASNTSLNTSNVGSYAASVVAAGMTPGANLVLNPDFLLGTTGWTIDTNWSIYANLSGSPAILFNPTSTAQTRVNYSNKIVIAAGVALSVGLDIYLNQTLTSGDISADIQYYTSADAANGNSSRVVILTATNGAFVRYTLNNQTAPAGTAYCKVRVFVEAATSTSAAVFVRRVKLEVGAVATPFNDDATQLGNNLTVAGSGQVMGNQLNAPNSLTLNYGAARTTTAVTASSTGAVSINAFSVNMGGTTVSYSAVSNAITGLAQSVTYQIYCHDLGGTGGTKTWLAVAGTANALLTLGDDVVLAGQVTIPTSGTSGGGGGGYCVCDNMMIDDDTLAGEAPIGYLFDCLDIPTQGMRKFRRRLQAVEYTTVPCVRITTDAGAILECSTTTPFDVLDGRTVYAPDMLGEQVVTDKGIENVARVKDIGERRVCHIHLGGVSYAAGADPAHRIYSHNLKP